MSDSGLFDPGLQPERTELAWRRTGLAIGVGSLIALRMFPPLAKGGVEFAVSLAPGIIGLAFAAWLVVNARSRYRRWNRALLEGRREQSPGGRLLFAVTLFVIAAAAGGGAVIAVTLTR